MDHNFLRGAAPYLNEVNSGGGQVDGEVLRHIGLRGDKFAHDVEYAHTLPLGTVDHNAVALL